MQLISGYVLVRVEEDAKVRESGLTMPESMQPWYVYGKVVLTSRVRFDHGKVISVGLEDNDRVVFPRDAGRDMSYEGEQLRLIKITDVIGVERMPE